MLIMHPAPIAELFEIKFSHTIAFLATARPMGHTLTLSASKLNQSFLGFLCHKAIEYQNRGRESMQEARPICCAL